MDNVKYCPKKALAEAKDMLSLLDRLDLKYYFSDLYAFDLKNGEKIFGNTCEAIKELRNKVALLQEEVNNKEVPA